MRKSLSEIAKLGPGEDNQFETRDEENRGWTGGLGPREENRGWGAWAGRNRN